MVLLYQDFSFLTPALSSLSLVQICRVWVWNLH